MLAAHQEEAVNDADEQWHPTPALQWKGRTLQQRWARCVRDSYIRNGTFVPTQHWEHEWRDLPEPARGHWVRGLLTVALVDQPNSIISSSMVNRANMAPERCSSCGGGQRYTLMGRSICSLCGEDIASRAPDTTPASPEG